MTLGEAEKPLTEAVADTGTGPEPAAGAATADPVEAPAVHALAVVATHYPIAPGYSVNVRSGPGTNHGVVRILPVGASVSVNCQMYGTTETGPYGTTRIWDNIANGQFVSDAYVHTGSDGFIAPRCD
ncbi:SH3 domain-containing protein [Streptomyces sp. NBC_01497]|uniref:SH3 domain-containing protein n=1 Tax=Streptomyces sp. NBC_01497 TaxID=2903885 RepID=UPI002E37CDE9|nr:SH3 domain-containing protein [Streptomyces sp. NBC_01497]